MKIVSLMVANWDVINCTLKKHKGGDKIYVGVIYDRNTEPRNLWASCSVYTGNNVVIKL